MTKKILKKIYIFIYLKFQKYIKKKKKKKI